MNLGTLHTIFSKLDNDSFVFKNGFGNPMSYRGDYSECAFPPEYKLTLSEIKQNIESALTDEFIGYRGGEYKFEYSTSCHLSDYGDAKDDDGEELENLIGKMLIEYYSA